REQGEYAEAAADLQQALTHGYITADAHDCLGDCFFYFKQYDAALAAYDEAIRLAPEDGRYYVSRGSVLYQKGQIDEERGITDYQEGQLDRDLSDLSIGLRLAPEFSLGYFWRGLVLLEKKEFKKALDDFDQALRLNPDDPVTHSSRATT